MVNNDCNNWEDFFSVMTTVVTSMVNPCLVTGNQVQNYDNDGESLPLLWLIIHPASRRRCSLPSSLVAWVAEC
jgi:hypothetical protein